jgi:hypothetical protein
MLERLHSVIYQTVANGPAHPILQLETDVSHLVLHCPFSTIDRFA